MCIIYRERERKRKREGGEERERARERGTCDPSLGEFVDGGGINVVHTLQARERERENERECV